MPVTTLNQILNHCLERHPRDDLFAYKDCGTYRSVSTDEFAGRVRLIALGLVDLGVKKKSKVALLSENRLEWAIADLAILSAGAINVPIFSTLPSRQVLHILRDSKVDIIIVSDHLQLEKIEAISDKIPGDPAVVVVDTENVQNKSITTFEEINERGISLQARDPDLFSSLSEKISPLDVATIIYTSGTTGPPKGVVLTHRNIISNVEAVLQRIPVDRSDTVLSFLPLSHILERMAGFYSILYAGGSISYAESVETVREDMAAVSPTLLITVPRFLEKVHENILETISTAPGLRKKIFEWSINIGQRELERVIREGTTGRDRTLRFKIADKLVFPRLRKEFGGRIRFFISGGAPLPASIARFFYAVGLPVYEGYGLTETSPVISCNGPVAWKIGSVGQPVPGVEVKIAPDGEILAKGESVMAGYFEKEEETMDTLDGDWLHTGDVGRIDEDGFLYITDRKKDLIVTSGGKNIAPQPIEMMLRKSRFIKEAVLIGNARKYISALIVPDLENVSSVIGEEEINSGTNDILIEDPEVRNIIAKEIDKCSRGLASYEQVKRFLLIARDFRIAEGELTPTLKVKRHHIEKEYQEIIDSMYE